MQDYKRIIIMAIIFGCLFTNSISLADNIYGSKDDSKNNEELQEYCKAVEIKEGIGQLFIVGMNSVDYTNYLHVNEDDYLIENLNVGGIMLNTYNFYIKESKLTEIGNDEYFNKIKNMVNHLNNSAIKSGIPVFIAVDFEGRYSSITKGISRPPSALTIGHIEIPSIIKDLGLMVGNELSGLGINMILGPVLDTPEGLEGTFDRTLIERFFSNREDITSAVASHYLEGIKEGGVMAVSKHFPGYCDLDINPHSGSSIFNGNMNTLLRNISIYHNLNSLYDGIMSANYYMDEIDKNRPIMLSNEFKSLLTEASDSNNHNLLEDNIIITDDFSNMKLIEEYKTKNGLSYTEIVIQAFDAGHDMILFSHMGDNGKYGDFDVIEFENLLEELTHYIENNSYAEEQFRKSLYKVLRLKHKYNQQIIGQYDFVSSWARPDVSDICSALDVSSVSKNYDSNNELIIDAIKNGAVISNEEIFEGFDNKGLIIVSTSPELLSNGTRDISSDVEEYKVCMNYKSYDVLNEEADSIYNLMKNETKNLIFVIESKDHFSILERLIKKMDNNFNSQIIIFNHTVPTMLSENIHSNFTIFSTMSVCKESFEVDKMFIKTKYNWSKEYKLNIGENKSICNVQNLEYNMLPSDGIVNDVLFYTLREKNQYGEINNLKNEIEEKNDLIKDQESEINSKDLSIEENDEILSNKTYKIENLRIRMGMLILIIIILSFKLRSDIGNKIADFINRIEKFINTHKRFFGILTILGNISRLLLVVAGIGTIMGLKTLTNYIFMID